MREELVTGRIGTYGLEGVVGTGGMAVVFSASESNSQRRYALKTLTGDRALAAKSQQHFQREVQAMARLNHPAIVRVYDFGEVQDHDAIPEGFGVEEGSPWLAMEYIDGEELSPEGVDGDWQRFEGLLMTILDGLAHAHADGILHRDLKPSNVIVVEEEGRTDVRLVDFGIARIYESEEFADSDREAGERTVGTPNYMAPEQIQAKPRRQGPWTDLYAFGALVWALVTGAPPFEEESSSETMMRHLEEPLPAFEPTMPVPEGLEAWLHRLLQKSPEDRFQRAADAAWALLKLGAPTAPENAPSEIDRVFSDRPTLEKLEMARATTRIDELPPDPNENVDLEADGPEPSVEPMPDAIPPTPDSWERGGHREDDTSDDGPILGERLLGLRRVPLVDREGIRATMWKALRRVARNARPEAIVLEGPEGFGKSRLAKWCVRRAHELGAAHVLKAQYSRGPSESPQDGLGPMLARHYRCVGLTEEEIIEELAARGRAPTFDGPTGHHDRIRLAGMMAVTDREKTDSMRYSGFESSSERHRVAAEVILQIARRRAAVVWLDDIHQGPDGIDFCRYLFDKYDGDRPVLFVLTAGDASVGSTARANQKIRAFAEHDRVEHMNVGPLSTPDTERLVGDGLGLVEGSAAATAERAEGNPLFAIELVRHWADVGKLSRTEEGFTVDEPALEEVPDDVRRVWILRLYDTLDELPDGDAEPARELLVLGALLGRNVREREWRGAAQRYPHTTFEFDRLLRPMVRRGLLVPEDEGWEFAHGLLRKALCDWYDDLRKVRTLHAAIGASLAACHGEAPSVESERVANHFLKAGLTERALDFFESALDWYLEDGRDEEFQRALRRYRKVGDRLDDDERRRRVQVRARVHEQTRKFRHRDLQHDGTALEALLERAEEHGWRHERALIHHLLGRQTRHTGRSDRAETHYREADKFIDVERWPNVAFKIISGLGNLLQSRGRHTAARRALKRALELADRAGLRTYRPVALADLGYLDLVEGRLDRAKEQIQEALESSREAGARTLEPRTYNMLGEVCRERGEVEEARRAYRQALERFAGTSIIEAILPMLNLGMLSAQDGRIQEAEGYFWGVSEEAATERHEIYKAASSLGLAYCAAESGRWEEADERLGEARRELDSRDTVTVDFAKLAERLGETAQRAGRQELARRGYRLALRQRRKLDHHDRAMKLKDRLEMLNNSDDGVTGAVQGSDRD